MVEKKQKHPAVPSIQTAPSKWWDLWLHSSWIRRDPLAPPRPAPRVLEQDWQPLTTAPSVHSPRIPTGQAPDCIVDTVTQYKMWHGHNIVHTMTQYIVWHSQREQISIRSPGFAFRFGYILALHLLWPHSRICTAGIIITAWAELQGVNETCYVPWMAPGAHEMLGHDQGYFIGQDAGVWKGSEEFILLLTSSGNSGKARSWELGLGKGS